MKTTSAAVNGSPSCQCAGFAESFKAYLAIRGTSPDDPFVPEARKLAGGQ